MIGRSRVRLPAGALPGNDSGQVVHANCASVTKQCNLVPAKGRRCSAAGKVTVGLASHRPCVTDFVVYTASFVQQGDDMPSPLLAVPKTYPPTAQWPLCGRWAPRLRLRGTAPLPLQQTTKMQCKTLRFKNDNSWAKSRDRHRHKNAHTSISLHGRTVSYRIFSV